MMEVDEGGVGRGRELCAEFRRHSGWRMDGTG